jgi:hypothetical protein
LDVGVENPVTVAMEESGFGGNTERTKRVGKLTSGPEGSFALETEVVVIDLAEGMHEDGEMTDDGRVGVMETTGSSSGLPEEVNVSGVEESFRHGESEAVEGSVKG